LSHAADETQDVARPRSARVSPGTTFPFRPRSTRHPAGRCSVSVSRNVVSRLAPSNRRTGHSTSPNDWRGGRDGTGAYRPTRLRPAGSLGRVGGLTTSRGHPAVLRRSDDDWEVADDPWTVWARAYADSLGPLRDPLGSQRILVPRRGQPPPRREASSGPPECRRRCVLQLAEWASDITTLVIVSNWG
jgi:hypothetical protein